MKFSLSDYHFNLEQKKPLLYYKGHFDEVVLNKMGGHLRTKFPGSPKAGKKLFAIFMELAQNISFYSAECNFFEEGECKGVGAVVVHDTEESICFTAGNLVGKDKISEIVRKCDEINRLKPDELRELKRHVRSRPRKEGQRGGNIGLIQVAIKSGNPLRVEAREIDEKLSFLILSTEIKKDTAPLARMHRTELSTYAFLRKRQPML